MKREIKFRAWDGEEKRMWKFGIFDVDGHWNYPESGMMPQQLEIMQYTGLKDKNGKEIYEGDIVGGGHVVEWLGDGWKIKVNTPKGERHYTIFSKTQEELDFVDRVVIGNIWENPDLIT